VNEIGNLICGVGILIETVMASVAALELLEVLLER